MSKRISRIENDVQDRNSVAWVKLCEYIDLLAENESDEFSPREYLGNELFSNIYTLPESISKLKKVKKIWLYGSKLKRIPPEIGQMDSLEYFDPYTSYDLHWFPFEIIDSIYLKDSRISTRTLYGNYKNRMGFPRLDKNPVRYFREKLHCSVCKKEITYEVTNQLWISLKIGTDIVPLLINSCSVQCEKSLPKPPENYVQFPHKGGSELKQPPDDNELWEIEMKKRKSGMSQLKNNSYQESNKEERSNTLKVFKVIRKIWEK